MPYTRADAASRGRDQERGGSPLEDWFEAELEAGPGPDVGPGATR